MDNAIKIAKESDMVIIVCGDDLNTSGEGYDRSTLDLPGKQHELIRKVNQVNDNTILVLQTGRPVILKYESESVKAIVQAWFSGEKGSVALWDMIRGKYSPSGKTPISWPRNLGQIPSYYSSLPGTSSSRYYDMPKTNLYEFGYGLSYTSFEYSNINIQKRQEMYKYLLSFEIENTGKFDAKEVAQIYVEDEYSSIVTPKKELKAFEKVFLPAGRKKKISIELDFDSFKLLDKNFNWTVEPGDFIIHVGSSSEDIKLIEKLTIE